MPKAIFCALVLMLATTPALAQMGGMGGGGMGGGGMGGGMGGGGRGHGGDEEAPAERHEGGPQPHVMKAISREKFDKEVTAMFALADTNRDGMVTIAELQALVDARRETIVRDRFSRIDTNRNGQIDLAEFIAWQKGLGSAAASDCAGYANQDQIVTETLAPPLGSSEQDKALAILIEPLSAVMITRANVHYRAGLALDDLLTYENARFDAADTDHDSFLEQDEIEVALNAHGGHREHGPGGHGPHHEGGPPPGE